MSNTKVRVVSKETRIYNDREVSIVTLVPTGSADFTRLLLFSENLGSDVYPRYKEFTLSIGVDGEADVLSEPAPEDNILDVTDQLIEAVKYGKGEDEHPAAVAEEPEEVPEPSPTPEEAPDQPDDIPISQQYEDAENVVNSN